ncbi:cyclin-a1-1 [Anaeramoeba ignava]|uniref:Cyclin-a1-1 n=1 Tax=Anaeramoeba ignava TaxID=1746090 RepID=A0A9Q0LHL8_ANAIG|nr:cyclin-a1-1 [Anaeramoeba ignava]
MNVLRNQLNRHLSEIENYQVGIKLKSTKSNPILNQNQNQNQNQKLKQNRTKRPFANVTNNINVQQSENIEIKNRKIYQKKTVDKIKLKQNPLSSIPIPTENINMEISPVTKFTFQQPKPQYKDIDKDYKDDPQMVSEYAPEIFEHLKNTETDYVPSIDYMEKIQKSITPKMRKILVDWLVEVSQEYKFHSETLYLAVNYVDRFLSKFSVSKSQLQLLGASCLLIAAKYEEIYPPSVDDFVYISMNTYTRDNFLVCETKVCNALKFDFTVVTPKHFLRRFIRAGDSDVMTMLISNYLCELQLLEYSFLKYKPSIISASAVALSRAILQKRDIWDETLQHYTGFQFDDLVDCMKDLLNIYKNADKSSCKAVYEKYSNPNLCSVSKLKLPDNL